ncbi:hypothetical protein GmHk_02G004877 [Glycine max]|nr:hypothetical protein GmHk_02G004877 [Glycine max]
MGETDKVHERIKADLEAMKEQMAAMMEAMMGMKKIMEVNAARVAATSATTKVDLTPTSGLNQINHAISDMVGQRGKELGSTGGPYFVQVQNKYSFPPYGLAPNHTPPNVAHTPIEDVNNSAPIPIESQKPKADHAHVSQPMGETHEIPHYNLTNFESHLGYATKGQAVGGVPLPNTLEGPQFLPQPQPLHFEAGRIPLAMAEKGKDCKSDDTRRQLMVIRHLCHPETASPMTRRDNIWSSATFVIQRWQVRWNAYTTYGHPPPLSPSDDKSDGTWREHMVIRHLCHPETASLMTRGENIWSSATFVI